MEIQTSSGEDMSLTFSMLPRTQWLDYFFNVPINETEVEIVEKEIEKLKCKVKDMLLSSQGDYETSKKKIGLIHLLISLGLAYHFENEIEDILRNSFPKIEEMTADENHLYTISIMFCVFRTYGHNMSSNVFERFKGENGEFKECLTRDVLGMLSLYEASHFETTTDKILEKSMSFTSRHLKLLATAPAGSIPPHIVKLVKSVIYIPQCWNMEALVARDYISFYEQEEDHDETLLKLGKLHFKLMQLLYNKEMKTLTKWWKELDHTSKLPPEFRERVVEAWITALTMYFEPKYSAGRIIAAKIYYLLTIFDDACDEHFSLPEVSSLVDCIERWNREDLNTLEGLQRIIFEFLLDEFDEIEKEVMSEGKRYHFEEMLEEFKIIARANLKFVKWARGAEFPESIDAYMEVGQITIASYATIAATFIGMGEIAGKEPYEWLRSQPKLIKYMGVNARIMDDITDYEKDMSKAYAANGINYYMKQNKVSKKEAIKAFNKMINTKIINEELLKTTDLPRRVLMQAINFRRLLEMLYTMSDDIYNCHEGKLKEYIIILLVDPIGL